MTDIDVAMPRIFFDDRTGEVCGRLDTFYRDGGRLRPSGEVAIDAEVLTREYPNRCLAVRARNPDIPKDQAVEIAMRQWALELAGKQ